MKALLVVALVLSPGAVVANECGWCGSEAQALGKALNMGGDVACYCPGAYAQPELKREKSPPKQQPKDDPPVRRNTGGMPR